MKAKVVKLTFLFVLISFYQNCGSPFQSQTVKLKQQDTASSSDILGDAFVAQTSLKPLSQHQLYLTVKDTFRSIPEVELIQASVWDHSNLSRPFDNILQNNTIDDADTLDLVVEAANNISDLIIKYSNLTLNCSANSPDCSTHYITNFLPKLFRRPLAQEETDQYKAFKAYQENELAGNQENILRQVIRASLQDPAFLYRFEIGTLTEGSNVYKLTDVEYVTKISFFLTNKGPEQSILEQAKNGFFKNEGNLNLYIDDLLTSEDYKKTMFRFHSYWFGFSNFLGSKEPIIQSGMNEAYHLISKMISENKEWTYLLTSDEAYINDDLAKIYNMAETGDNSFRWEKFENNQRTGLLSQLAFLSGAYPLGDINSNQEKTNTTKRGYEIQKRILCSAVPPPPPQLMDIIDKGFEPKPGKSTCKTDVVADAVFGSTACNSCHFKMDKVAFGLEHFDHLGGYRNTDKTNCDIKGEGQLISDDPITGETKDHGAFRGVAGFRDKLISSNVIQKCLVRRLVEFNLGEVYNNKKHQKLVNKIYQKFMSSPNQSLNDLVKDFVFMKEFRYRVGG